MKRGTPVEKLPHVCGSRKGLQVFELEDGTYNGYCFACDTFVPDPYGDKPEGYKPQVVRKTKEEIEEEIKDIDNYPVVDLPDRKLRKESLDYFGIKIGLSEADGETPTTHYYPYRKHAELKGYKVRLIEDKRIWSIGDLHDVDLFGWDEAVASGSKKLFITEGEPDAVALYQALKDNQKGTKWEHIDPAVVSLPKGAGNAAKSIAAVLPDLRRIFAEIILVFDMDEAGRQAAEDVARICPEAQTCKLPEKDPNDCLLKGKRKSLCKAVLFQAAKPKNTRLVWGGELHEAGRIEAEWGFSWPWEQLTELTRGIRTGETIYIGAGVKMGKSELVNAIAAHLIREHKWKVFMAKPEEANRKSYQMVVGKMAGKIFHDPKIPFDYDAYDKFSPLVGDNLCMVNLYQHLGWETLKLDIQAAALEGCKAVIIDPITNLTNGMNAADANVKLQEIAQELSAMALDLDIVIFIFCHLKAPEGGPPHERGGAVQSQQFAGSRAMMRSCNYMIGLEGNKDPELTQEERNVRKIQLLEDREFGNVGSVGLFWDNKTGLFNEIPNR